MLDHSNEIITYAFLNRVFNRFGVPTKILINPIIELCENFQEFVKTYKLIVTQMGESTLQWPKNVVTNIVFQNCVTFNFHQTNIKRGFHKLYLK